MKIGLIGYGVVGKAAHNTFSKEYEVVIYDNYLGYSKFDILKDSDFVFIMVPTPFDCERNCVDDSAVLESLEKLDQLKFPKTVIIKSTLAPGSCDIYTSKFDLDIVFNPEFLRESTTPNEDFANQETVVIGTSSLTTFESVKEMYQRVCIQSTCYFHTSSLEAEFIKCSQNAMLASRVALANMIFDACTNLKISYDTVKKIAFDRFEILGPFMSQVPGPDGLRGFGGKCLPKDIRAFSTITDSDLLKEIIYYNDTLRDDLDTVLKNYIKPKVNDD